MAIRSPLFSFDLEETDRQKSNIICFLSSCSNDPLIPCESHHSRRCCWTFQLMFASDLWSLSNRRKKKLTYLNDQSSSIVLNCAFVRCVHAPSSCSVSVLTVVCLGVGLDAELSFLVTDGLCLFLLLMLTLSAFLPFSPLAFSVYRSSSSPHAPADSTDTSDWLCGQDAGEQ